MKGQPVSSVKWVAREKLHANSFNPNKVAPPEMRLLKISLLENGWTQPIVALPDGEIVDGFHRWTAAADPEIAAMTKGKVPVVTLDVGSETADHKMATIRHNRARGTHGVLDMSAIVKSMIESGLAMEEIMHRLQMEEEEVTRLALRQGIPYTDIVKDHEFSKAWEV